MMLVWILVAFWLIAAVVLPLYVLFAALFRPGGRDATPAERNQLLLTPRSYLSSWRIIAALRGRTRIVGCTERYCYERRLVPSK
jgi:hypothetical protein